MVWIFPDVGMTGKGEGAHHATENIEAPVIRHRTHDRMTVLDEMSKLSGRQEFRELRADLIQNGLIRQLFKRISGRQKTPLRRDFEAGQ